MTPGIEAPLRDTSKPKVQDRRRMEVEDTCSQLGGRMQVAETLLTAAQESGGPMEYPETEAVLEAVQEVREGLSEIVQVVYGRRDEDIT